MRVAAAVAAGARLPVPAAARRRRRPARSARAAARPAMPRRRPAPPARRCTAGARQRCGARAAGGRARALAPTQPPAAAARRRRPGAAAGAAERRSGQPRRRAQRRGAASALHAAPFLLEGVHQHLVRQPVRLGRHARHVGRKLQQRRQALQGEEAQPRRQRRGQAPGPAAGDARSPIRRSSARARGRAWCVRPTASSVATTVQKLCARSAARWSAPPRSRRPPGAGRAAGRSWWCRACRARSWSGRGSRRR